MSRNDHLTVGLLLLLAFVAVAAGPRGSAGPGAPTPESCVAAEPASDLDACHRVALGLADLHDYARAIAIEERVFERQPSNAAVAASLARMVQLGTKNTARAIALYHAALHATSGYPPALMGLGSIMQEKGETDLAARYYARAVKENPDRPLFKIRLAEVLLQSGRDAEAQPLIREVVQRWPASYEATSARKLMERTALARP